MNSIEARGEPPVPLPAAQPPRPARTVQFSSAFVIIATLALYLWLGQSSFGGWPVLKPPGEREGDHFNLLSRGFLKGHLHLDLAVPPEIVQAPNPYDPALRERVAVPHDASYYRGHYYLYFGPAPIVTLFAPFTLLTGRDLPLPVAVWIFSLAGYLTLTGIFFLVQRRHFPGASAVSVAAALVALGTGTQLVTLLRRSHIWELSIAAGFAFFALSLLCLLRALHSRRATAWAAAGGLALGLAVASRPTYLLCSALFALPLLFRRKEPAAAAGYRWPALVAAGASCAMIGVALAIYNYARFGHPLEFGVTYQLSGLGGEMTNRHFSFAYFGFNFRMYFLSALSWADTFPFLTGPFVPPRPPGHAGHEHTFGLLRNLPFSCLALAALAGLCGWRPRGAGVAQAWPAVALIAVAAALTSFVPLIFFGCCIRYMVDFSPWIMLLAACGFLAWEVRLGSPAARCFLRSAGVALAAYTALVGLLSIVNFYGSTPASPGSAFRPLARALNRPFFHLREHRWPGYAPTEIAFSLPADRTPRQEPIYTVTQGARETALVFIDYATDRTIRLGYREQADDRTATFSPAVAAEPGALHVLRLSVGGPYANFDGANAQLRAQLDTFALWHLPVVSPGVFPGAVSVGENPAAAGAARRFTGEIRSHGPLALSKIAGSAPTGVRVRFALRADMANRSFPIVTSGQTGGGDFLILRVKRDGKFVFTYDHWGGPGWTSAELALDPGQTAVAECWMPSLAAAGAEPVLTVRFNGKTFWRETVPFHAAAPATVVVGLNLIGGSSCERVFPHGQFENLSQPPPVEK